MTSRIFNLMSELPTVTFQTPLEHILNKNIVLHESQINYINLFFKIWWE